MAFAAAGARPPPSPPRLLGALVGLGVGGGLCRTRGRGRVGVERLALLVEVVAEVLRERLDGVVNRLLRLLRPVAPGDLLEHGAVLGVHPFGQLEQELGDALDVDAIQEAVRGRIDLHDLVLDRQRLALVLVERRHESLTAG